MSETPFNPALEPPIFPGEPVRIEGPQGFDPRPVPPAPEHPLYPSQRVDSVKSEPDPELDRFSGDIKNLVDQSFYVGRSEEGRLVVGMREGARLGLKKAKLDIASSRLKGHEDGGLSEANINFARSGVEAGYQQIREELGKAAARDPFEAQVFVLAADVSKKVTDGGGDVERFSKEVDRQLDEKTQANWNKGGGKRVI